MKKKYLDVLLYSSVFIVLFGCKKEPKIVLNQPYKITIESSVLDEKVKGVILSNREGGIFFEKIIDDIDRQRGLKPEILIDESHKVCVTFLNEDEFIDNQTYYDVKSGAIFKNDRLSKSNQNFRVIVTGLISQPQLWLNAAIKDTLFENNSLTFNVERFPSEQDLFLVIWNPNENNKRYFRAPFPENELIIDKTDFQLLHSEVVKLNGNSLSIEPLKVEAKIKDADKKVRLYTLLNSTKDTAEIFYPANDSIEYFDTEYNGARLGFSFMRNENLPAAFASIPCISQIDLEGRNIDEKTILFADKIRTGDPDFFVLEKRFERPIPFGRGYWQLRGNYEEDFFFEMPIPSNEMFAILPGLEDIGSFSFETIWLYNFDKRAENDSDIIPIFNNEYYFENQTKLCGYGF